MNNEQFGPLDALHAAIRRRLPQILVSRIAYPLEGLRVTYRNRGPANLTWNASAGEYQWTSGADPASYIGGPDPEEAIKSIAEYLGAALPPPTQ